MCPCAYEFEIAIISIANDLNAELFCLTQNTKLIEPFGRITCDGCLLLLAFSVSVRHNQFVVLYLNEHASKRVIINLLWENPFRFGFEMKMLASELQTGEYFLYLSDCVSFESKRIGVSRNFISTQSQLAAWKGQRVSTIFSHSEIKFNPFIWHMHKVWFCLVRPPLFLSAFLWFGQCSWDFSAHKTFRLHQMYVKWNTQSILYIFC